jgi:hypothetical protein
MFNLNIKVENWEETQKFKHVDVVDIIVKNIENMPSFSSSACRHYFVDHFTPMGIILLNGLHSSILILGNIVSTYFLLFNQSLILNNENIEAQCGLLYKLVLSLIRSTSSH